MSTPVDPVELTCWLIDLDTVNPPGNEAAAARLMGELMRESGLDVNYFSDASAFTPAFGAPPTIILGPGEATQAHQTDEWCQVEKIRQAADIYLEIARAWRGA